jgi:cytochrome b pre-mRNA-processing protein 3
MKRAPSPISLAVYYILATNRAPECHLPPTFQSWFTITNLHVWILTTRLRALPEPWGQYHVQFLLDNFFLDVEARIRDVCALEKRPGESSPPPSPPEPKEPGIVFADANKNVPLHALVAARKQVPSYYTIRTFNRRKHAPEVFISRQMKAFRDQYNGLTLALDLALAHGSDAELAAAIWRNLLGARGRDGIPYAHSAAEERARGAKDDGSGVREFVDDDVEKYVGYPQTMVRLVKYTRMEIARLAAVPDDVIVQVKRRAKELEDVRVGTEELMFKDIP